MKQSPLFDRLYCYAPARRRAGKSLPLAAGAALLSLVLLPWAGAATVRLALIEDVQQTMTMQLAQPIERILREAGPESGIKAADEILCLFSEGEYRLPVLGTGAPALSSATAVAALESDAEVVFIYPPDHSLIEALKKASADPATFRMMNSIRLSDARAALAVEKKAGGGNSLLLRAELAHPASARPQKGLAAYYDIRWKGGDYTVIVIGRAYGGLGRLAAAVAREGKERLTGLARGGTFGDNFSDPRGRALAEALERSGLAYSAVSASEIENWRGLLSYREERPGGIQYLSANLVYSSAPAFTVLPAYAVFQASGTRVGVVGLTPDRAGRALASSGLTGLEIADPVAALKEILPGLRKAADIVLVLSQLDAAGNARLAAATRGIDLIIADDAPFLTFSPPPSAVLEENGRPPFDNPLPPLHAYWPALNLVEITLTPATAGTDWKVGQRAVLLDDAFLPAPGFQEQELKPFAAARSSDTVLIPAARDIFSERARTGLPIFESRDFWTLAAAVLAEDYGAEAGLLPVHPLPNPTFGAVRESLAAQWLNYNETAILVRVPGALLNSLAEEAAGQKNREEAGLPISGLLPITLSGFDLEKKLVRGNPFNPEDGYLIATSRSAAETLHLPGPYIRPDGRPGLAKAVLKGLRAIPLNTGNAAWRSWMTGAQVSERCLWKVNFRDLSLDVRQTSVARSDKFDTIPNSRIQGINEFMAGGTLKTDAEYLHGAHKWTNTLELEYAKDRLDPRGMPATTNLITNRFMFLTLYTRRTGAVAYPWLARSWGPSIGVQTDGEFQALSGLERRQTYSAFPGVELYGGSLIETLSLTANITRDISRVPANTQTGFRVRALASIAAGPKGARLSAEIWNNYFFRANKDTPSDLRAEGQATVKYKVPMSKSLVLAPFVDLYWLQLKGGRAWGYSLMTGISIGFSRLWKPQYESF